MKCAECGAYQDARRHIIASSSILAAVLALVPLWSGAYSAYEIANPDAPRVQVDITECSANTVHLYLANTGERRAVLQRPIFQMRIGDEPWVYQRILAVPEDPVEEDDLSIDPGEVDMIRITNPMSGFFSEEDQASRCLLGVAIPWVGEEREALKATCKCQSF